MRAGNLRHTISIQEQVETADGIGGYTLVWQTLFETRAAIWPLSSNEQLDAMKLESTATNRIRIRYRSGITSKNRVLFGTRVFNILGAPINHDERSRQLEFIVSEEI